MICPNCKNHISPRSEEDGKFYCTNPDCGIEIPDNPDVMIEPIEDLDD